MKVLIVLVLVVAVTAVPDGYYWRDYIGVIPNDAVPGGKDEKGETTFIGQALHSGGQLTPGVIKKGETQVFYEFGDGAHGAEEDVKILCSQHPQQLVWLHIYDHDSILNINGTQLIIAGHDAQSPLSIGRKAMGSEVGVGKVRLSSSQFVGLWYATSAYNYESVSDHFELLVFNPEADIGKIPVTRNSGYYWRDYTGVIPSDALPAGRDEVGQTTFIGQALHPGGHLTPGVIMRESNKVYYEFDNQRREADEDVKILCSQHPEQLVWLHVKGKVSIFNIICSRLIIAGHDNAGPLSIGRKLVDSQMRVVGKVTLADFKFGRFWYATNKEHNHVDDEYEVLVMDSNVDCGESSNL